MVCKKNNTQISDRTLVGGAIGAVVGGLPGMVVGGLLGSMSDKDKRKKE